MGRISATILGATALFALASCSDDGGSSVKASQTEEGKAYVDAMMSQFDASSGFTKDQGRCIAELTIDTVGIQELKDAGITPENVNDTTDASSSVFDKFKPDSKQADAIIDGVFGCVDFGEVMLTQLSGTGNSLPIEADKVRCVGQAMEKSTEFHDFLKATLLNVDSNTNADIQALLRQMFTDCGVDLSQLGG